MKVVVIGAQWGDEGKGKIVDYLAEDAEYVVRYAGGPNGADCKSAGYAFGGSNPSLPTFFDKRK